MKAEPLGEAAWILRDLEVPAFQAAQQLNEAQLDGLLEAFASYDTVGLFVDPARFSAGSLPELKNVPFSPKTHLVPVCYEMGSDLGEVCEVLDVSEDIFIEAHSSQDYRCYAIGFCPGFAYLGYLDDRIAGLPRRPSPRTAVPKGSVGVTGSQTAVYPLERPGGWSLVGRTPLELVNVEDEYFPIEAGDLVRFCRIDEKEFQRLSGERL